MRFSKKVMAVGLCAALAPVCAVPAQAEVIQQDKQVAVEGERSTPWTPYINATLRPDGQGQFDYVHPEAAVEAMKYALSTEAYVGGQKMPVDWNATPKTSSAGGTDTVTYTQEFNGVSVDRNFIIYDDSIRYTVNATNITDTPVAVRVESLSHIAGDHGKLRAQQYFGKEVRIIPEKPGYVTRVTFRDAERIGVGPTAAYAKQRNDENVAPYQAAHWSKTLQPKQNLAAETLVRFTAQPEAFDSDGDGLRNSWERAGMTLANGTVLPIHEWGADENKPDLFLQLNWMESEWESLKCEREESFAASVEGFTQFADCARANTKDYTPSPEVLKQLENRFNQQDINLHIDAGSHYVSPSLTGMAPKDRQGGKTEKYRKEYMPGLDGKTGWDYAMHAREQFIPERERLLKDRKAAFRVGVIGDTISHRDTSTGLALINDSIFFVANHAGMTTQDQLRNTILHEFGHTLNLLHYGAHVEANTAPERDDLEEYKSVMSYAHQFTKFNFAEEDTNGTDEAGRKYKIPADWANLNLAGENVGRGYISVTTQGQKEDGEHEDDHGHDHSHGEDDVPVLNEGTVEELVVNAADSNKRMAGFSLRETKNGDNGVVAQLGDDNILRATVSNLGSVDETFTVSVDYGTGVFKQSYDLKPAGKAGDRRPVNIQLGRAALIDKPVVPLNVSITNSSGTEVFSDSYSVSALNYSRDEMAKVLKEVLASDAPAYVKNMARKKLQPKNTSEKASNAPAAQKPAQQQPPAESGSSASPVAIVVGVLLALGGLGAALYGWALNQGMI